MAPVQIGTALPIPRVALTCLDKARQKQSLDEKKRIVNSIVTAALADGAVATTAPAKYVLRRLVNGVSVSSGSTRANYSAALLVLARSFAQSSETGNVDELVRFVKDVYGVNGSFDLSYSGAERERALGTIASCAAVVEAAASKFSANAARDVVSLLRQTVNAAASQWRLGCAAVHIVEKMLSKVGKSVKESLAKPLWQWCTERKETEDGIQLALVLYLQARIVGHKAFQALYPSVSGSFSIALMDTFERGFSYLANVSVDVDKSQPSSSVSLLPRGWTLALSYIFSPEGSEHLGGVKVFWDSIVVEKLIKGSRSGDKKLVAVELILASLEHVKNTEDFDMIFESSVAAMVLVLAGKKRPRRAGIGLRRGRMAANVAEHMTRIFDSLGERIIAEINKESRSEASSTDLLRSFLLWCVRGGVLHHLLSPPLIAQLLANLDGSNAALLFSEAVDEFAQPRHEGKKADELSVRRSNTIRFIFEIARKHRFLAKDVVKVVMLYTVFEGAVSSPKKSSMAHIGSYKKRNLRTEYCGVLPLANPEVSPELAGVVFRKLVSFISEFRMDSDEDRISSFAFEFMKEVLSKETTLCPKNSMLRIQSNKSAAWTILSDVAVPLMKKLSKKPPSRTDDPLADALRIITEFNCLILYEPLSPEIPNREGGAKHRSNLSISLFEDVRACVNSLYSTGKRKRAKDQAGKPKTENSSGLDDEPQPIEQIAHLITDLCGREAASSRQIAIAAVEALGSRLDDNVVAVLFDAMDNYLSGAEVADGNDSDDSAPEEMEDAEVRAVPQDSNDADESSSDEFEDGKEVGDDAEAGSKAKGVGEQQINSGEESESEDEVNIDIEKEDPAVLAELDKRLATHMRLLQDEKKSSLRRKLENAFKYVKVSRILDVIETVAKLLRLRLEKEQDNNTRSPVVFLHLHVRLYEFAFSSDADNMRFLKRVTSIIAKHMILPVSLFASIISDAETVSELCDRFFEAVLTCKSERNLGALEASTISKSVGCLTGVSAALSDGDYSQFLKYFEQMTQQMFDSRSHLCRPYIFTSFVQRAPRLSVKLLPYFLTAIRAEEQTKTIRSLASEMLLALSTCSCQEQALEEAELKEFWSEVRRIIVDICTDQQAKGKWTTEGFAHVLHTAAVGLKGGHITDTDDLISQLTAGVQGFTVIRRERVRLLKSIKASHVSNAGKRKDRPNDGAELGESVKGVVVKRDTKGKKRKRA